MKFRKIAFLLAIVMLMACFSGCSNNKKSNDGEMVTINWVMPGPGVQKDSEEVFKAINEKLKTYKGFENVELNITPITTSDYA